MIDTEELKDDGYDLGTIAHCCELAMFGLRNAKSKESQVVLNMLENLRDDCEANDDE